MRAESVTPAEFLSLFPSAPNVYVSAPFCELNAPKADRVEWIVARDSRLRLGLVAGLRGGVWRSSWSAPFGGFLSNRRQSAEVYAGAIGAISAMLAAPLAITLPPTFYSPEAVAATAAAMLSAGARQEHVLNYHYPLDEIGSYVENLPPNSRRYYNMALGHGFTFSRLDPADSAALALVYGIIARNRAEQGYPLAMTLADVAATVRVVAADLFLLTSPAEGPCASALVYRAAPGVAQVIYWGDVASGRHLQPMSLLPAEIFRYYAREGFRAVDLGPAGDFGNLNSGLAAFKERVGALPSLKLRLTL